MSWFTRRKYRPIQMADGSILRQIPEESPRKDWVRWAEQEWARYDRGQFGMMGGGCPGCYYRRSIETDEYAMSVCPTMDGIRRWKRHIALDTLKAEAAGDCRCGGGTGPMVLGPGESFTFEVR